jgi:hypothetical protein
MTVQVETPRNTFTGDAIEDTFAFTFRILENSHLVVEVDGVTQTEITHYTLASLTDLGGDVVFVAAPADGAAIVVYRAVPKTQEVVYNPYDPFPAATHELALDKLTMMNQDNTDATVNLLGVPAETADPGDVLTIDAGDNYVFVEQVGKGNILDQVLVSVAGVLTVDWSLGQSVYLAMHENITSTVVTGLPTDSLAQIEFEVDQDDPVRTWVYPAGITWVVGTEPDLTTVDGKSLVRIRTRDGGTSWMGTFGLDFS